MRFETVARHIAAAPRAIVLGLVAFTLVLSSGGVRVGVGAPASDAPEGALFALTCAHGVWSRDCLAQVDALTGALAEFPALVARIDSLTTRRQIVADGGALRLRPLVEAVPETREELRRIHARALDDPSATRGLVSGDFTTLVRAELRAGAPPAAVHALVEGLRARFERPPDVTLAVTARAWAEGELALGARRELARVLPVTLGALAAFAALALASVRAGLLVAALAGAAIGRSAPLARRRARARGAQRVRMRGRSAATAA